mgnify:CR=1 FL=1
MSTTITNALPNIPRLYTAICEWLACLVYLHVVYRRTTRRRMVIVLILGMPVMIAIQYLDGVMTEQFWILGMLLAFSGMAMMMAAGSGSPGRETLYNTSRAFVLAELVASLHWQVATFMDLNGPVNHASWLSLCVLLLTYAICFALAWFVERTNFNSTAPATPSASAVTATVAITVVTFAMSNLSFVSTNTPFSGKVGQEVFYIRTLVDCCGFAVLYAQQEQARRITANAELASIDAQLESQHQEYLQSRENLEALGRLSHDLKHQIAALRAEFDPNRVAQGFEQLEESVRLSSVQQHTGNPVLDVILTSKTRICTRRHITFTAVADGKLLSGLSSMDIASLFGNALDNAIEATSQLRDPQQRLIRLALYKHSSFVVMRVENYYGANLRTDSAGNLRTTKKDSHSHGYGVKSMHHIARQYGGEMTIQTDNHWFTVTVMFPVASATAA